MSDQTKKIPGIMVNTIPKSGTYYIRNALHEGLNILATRVIWGGFSTFILNNLQLKRLAEGDLMCVQHIPPTFSNRKKICKYLKKMVVHLRDPRMLSLEWLHHLNEFLERKGQPSKQSFDTESIFDPNDYFTLALSEYLHNFEEEDDQEALFSFQAVSDQQFLSLSMEERCEWAINNYMPMLIKWIEGWLDANEDPTFTTKLLITCQEDIVNDEDAFWASILDFYEIERTQFKFKPYKPEPGDYSVHFRNASTDEWREAFTPKQIKTACNMMPERLTKHFGWPKD